MRKITAIVFFLAFAFAQYTRQALYLECKLSNNYKTITEKCDCDKKAGLDLKEPGQPIPKTHTHIHPDELFPVAKHSPFEICPFLISQVLYFPGNEDLCEGKSDPPSHPPRPTGHPAA